MQKMAIDGIDQGIQDAVLAKETPESPNGGDGETKEAEQEIPSPRSPSQSSPLNADSLSEHEESDLKPLSESSPSSPMKPTSTSSIWEEEVVDDSQHDENGRGDLLEEEVLEDDDGEYDEEEFLEEIVDEDESMRRLAVGGAVANDDNATEDEVYAAALQDQFDQEDQLAEDQRRVESTEEALYRSNVEGDQMQVGSFDGAAFNSTAGNTDVEGQFQNQNAFSPPPEQAPVFRAKEPEKPIPSPSHMWYWASCLLLLGLIGAGAGVGYWLTNQDGDETTSIEPENRTNAPTSGPTVGVTTEFEPVQGDCNFIGVDWPNPIDQCDCAGSILAVPPDVESRYQLNTENFISTLYADFDEEISSCSARNQALVWISSGNDVELTVEERTQKYSLTTIFASLGGAQWDDRTKWLTNSDPCTWFGLECDASGFVVSMNLEENNVVGVVSTSRTCILCVR